MNRNLVRRLVWVSRLLTALAAVRAGHAVAQPPVADASPDFARGPDEIRAMLDSLWLPLDHFRTTYEIRTYRGVPIGTPRPDESVEPLLRRWVDMVYSDGRMKSVIRTLDEVGEWTDTMTWDGAVTANRVIDMGRPWLYLKPGFGLFKNNGFEEAHLHLIADRIPADFGSMSSWLDWETHSQAIDGPLLTQVMSRMNPNGRGCTVGVIRLRLEPRLSIDSAEYLFDFEKGPAAALEGARFRIRFEFEGWSDRHGPWLPDRVVREVVAEDRDAPGEMNRHREVYERTSFEDLTANPPQPETFHAALEPGLRVADEREGFVVYAVGGRDLQIGRLTFDLTEPIAGDPLPDLPGVVKRGVVYESREVRQAEDPSLDVPDRGGPGDAVRAKLRAGWAERPTWEDAPGTTMEDLEAHAAALREFHARGAALAWDLFEAEPSAPELVDLLPYRWKHADRLAEPIDIVTETARIKGTFPGWAEALLAGRCWRAMHRAADPNLTFAEREKAIDRFVEVAPDDPRGARLLVVASLVSPGSAPSEHFRRRVADEYRDTWDGKSVFAEVRKKEMVGEPVEFTIFDHLSGTEISSEDLRGKIVVLEFWATWCGPCVQSMPHVKEAYAELKEKYGEKVVFIGVSLDSHPNRMLEFVRQHSSPGRSRARWGRGGTTRWRVTSASTGSRGRSSSAPTVACATPTLGRRTSSSRKSTT